MVTFAIRFESPLNEDDKVNEDENSFSIQYLFGKQS